MSKGQTATTTKSGTKTRKPVKEHDGLFKPGNTIGIETRVKIGEALALKYKDEYADEYLKYAQRNDLIYPSLEGWTIESGIPYSTATTWLASPEKYPQFVYAHEVCKTIQRQRLIEKGLADVYNASIVKFVLSANHGMKEKQETEVNGSSTLNVNIREVD